MAKGVITALSAVAVALSAAPAWAGHAHEHGVAELRVAVEGGEVAIEFATPLDNLVGFEHEPRTDGQRRALAAAEERLQQAQALFVLPEAAGCTVQAVSLDSPWPQGGGHAHDHDDGHDHGAGHAELVVDYRLRCSRPAALDGVQVRLFEAFPRLREIRAQRVSARGQGAAVLRPGKTALPL